jgi:type III pantothenate kinase
LKVNSSVSSLILVDVGNTSCTLGLAINGQIRRIGRVPTHVLNPLRAYQDAVGKLLRNRHAQDSVLCSVVPGKDRSWIRVLRNFTGNRPLQVSTQINLGIDVRYPHPETIGADRLANAAAVIEQLGTPAIVADFGTALTFDVIAPDGAYVGGVIAPGLPLMTHYLAERTALLPQITLHGRYGRYGRSTVEAMRIGAMVGYRGMVREILHHLMQSFPGSRPHLAATGGYATQALKGLTLSIQIDPHLTLKGLVQIYRLNRFAP